MIQVSFQGERGAYSEAAAKSFFSDNEITPIPCTTFAEVLEKTTTDKTDYAVLPVENSLEGSVGESYDLLYTTPLNATGEIYHRIEHCLIGIGKLDEIETVYSHPQALGQCRKFIELHGMRTIPTYDTAGSVKIVKELNKKNCACIASKAASTIYGMPIVSEKIANNQNNYTRFLILSKKNSAETGNDKTSIIFSIKHEPGSLYRIIENFHKKNINMTKIESRPTRENTWEYNFYVDFEGHEKNPKILEILDKIKKETIFLKILGSYPCAKLS
ncbi:MAG: prephenate dehydratase [Nitrosopumilus sp.]|uniref:prephenate dehydratase n=1 Tax=Nitrosopumilus sp. TaxID=2024843 RepID=UPI00292E43AC|nr:prephenate dehydratase [Nitrosopumilus sp.]